MEVASEFRTKILRRCATPDEYTIYRAGLEWDLTDPIVIRNQDDFKSTSLWEDRLTPYYHQVSNLITFCRRLPVTLLADDVGLGKTISAGLIASELISRSRLSKILIVCPKLLGPQWKAELHEKFGIKSEIAIGKDLIDADLEGGGAIITTYNSARLHLDAIPEDRFQMLILDEAHKLRNLYGYMSRVRRDDAKLSFPKRVIQMHRVEPNKRIEEIARDWVQSFGAKLKQVEAVETSRCFEGTSLVRIRATVAHDSYERLVNVKCSPEEHSAVNGPSALGPLAKLIEAPASVGINVTKLEEAARLDDAISEFSRFYLERREQETVAAGADERKRKKLEDEFTPRLDMTLVGVEGRLYRQVKVRAKYSFEDSATYDSEITVIPYRKELTDAPISDLCLRSGRSVPRSCLTKCDVTGGEALRHLLVKSDVSGRFALPEFTATCTLSGKRILEDEGERSAVSGKLVTSSLLKVSGVSGKRAEPEHFVRCEFTGVDLLSTECRTSEVSAKLYRADEKMKSAVSGKTGHKLEFTACHETRQPIALVEAEQCEVTGKSVRPGILEKCSATNKRVLPSELERCGATGRRALRHLLVTSSLSHERVLEEIAVRSASGKFCTPAEVQSCLWSGGKYHPDDIRICTLTGISVHFRFVTAEEPLHLSALLELLNGTKNPADGSATWERVAEVVSSGLGGSHCVIEAAAHSPTGNHLAVSSTIKTFMRLRVRHAGAIYEVASQTIIGRIAEGHREAGRWSPTRR